MNRVPKELHLYKSLDKLREDAKCKNLERTSASLILRTAELLFTKGTNFYLEGDQELAFYYCFRYTDAIMLACQKEDFIQNKDAYEKLVSTEKLKYCVDVVAELEVCLKKRYAQLQESEAVVEQKKNENPEERVIRTSVDSTREDLTLNELKKEEKKVAKSPIYSVKEDSTVNESEAEEGKIVKTPVDLVREDLDVNELVSGEGKIVKTPVDLTWDDSIVKELEGEEGKIVETPVDSAWKDATVNEVETNKGKAVKSLNDSARENSTVYELETEEGKLDGIEGPGIAPRQLKTLLRQKAKILFVDCRNEKSFSRNRVNHHYCINIPEAFLFKGMSATMIQNILEIHDPESYSRWRKRNRFDCIVLYDRKSTFESRCKTLEIVYDSLTKWDPIVPNAKQVLVVEGGYKSIAASYPKLLKRRIRSKSKVDKNPKPNSGDDEVVEVPPQPDDTLYSDPGFD